MPSQRRNRNKKTGNDAFKKLKEAAVKMGCDHRAVNLAIDENVRRHQWSEVEKYGRSLSTAFCCIWQRPSSLSCLLATRFQAGLFFSYCLAALSFRSVAAATVLLQSCSPATGIATPSLGLFVIVSVGLYSAF